MFYGPNWRKLPPEEAVKFSDGHLFEKYSKIFEITYLSSDKQQQDIQPLFQRVCRNGPLNAQEVQKLMENFGQYQNFRSNAIEGSKITLSETQAILLSDLCPSGKLSDVLAVVCHHKAWNQMCTLTRSKRSSITLDFILQLHSLVTGSDETAKPGKLRDTELVRIKRSKVLLAHPVEVAALMHKLLDWLHSTSMHPIDVVTNFHQRFIRIHPFCDGNGRTCRLLCSLIALQSQYGPLLFRETKNEEYFTAIRKWEQEQDPNVFGRIVWNEMSSVLRSYELCFTKERIDENECSGTKSL